MTNQKTLLKFRPDHLRICILYFQGVAEGEIAAKLGYTLSWVSQILSTTQAEDILKELAARTLDTVLDVQTIAQGYAPACLDEVFNLALNARDERVKNQACGNILAIAGHQPVRRIAIERPDSISEKYANKTEEQLVAELMAGLQYGDREQSEAPPLVGETLH